MNPGIARFDDYFRRYYEEIYRYVSALFPLTAEDVVQDTFLALFNQLDQIEEKTLRAWLYRVAHNKGIDQARASKVREKHRHQAQAPQTTDAIAQPETQALVRMALARMPERQSQLLHLYSCGLSYEEMAEVMDVRASSISQLLLRAKKAFANQLLVLPATKGTH